jgi:hypothetical protein
MADTGWAGRWEPNVVGEGTLNELRDRVGQPVFGEYRTSGNGHSKGDMKPRPEEWCRVSLKTGEVRYPDYGS